MTHETRLIIAIAVLVIAALSAVPGTSSQGPPPTPVLKGETAQDYLERGTLFASKIFDTGAALADLSTAIELDPTLTAAYIERGKLYHSVDAFDLARDDFAIALELNPDSEEALLGRARYHLAIARWENFDQARQDIDHVLDLNPNSLDAIVARGELYEAQDRLDEAYEQFTDAVNRDPENLTARRHRLEIAFDMVTVPDTLMTDLDYVLEKAIDRPWYYNFETYDYYRRNQRWQAMEPCNEGLERFPNDATLLDFCTGIAAITADDVSVALALVERAIELVPESPQFRVTRGIHLRQSGNIEGAVVEFETALTLQPGYVPATNEFLQMYLYSPLHQDCEQAGFYLSVAYRSFPETTLAESRLQSMANDYTTLCTETDETAYFPVDHPDFETGTTIVVPGAIAFQLGSEPGLLHGGPLCSSGTTATVLGSVAPATGDVWVQVECDAGTGWVPEALLE